MLAKHSSQYITIHHNAMSRGVVPTRRLTWSEDVWQCLTVSNVSECVWQMSDMICSAKHFDPLQAAPLMKQNFLLPRCQWHLHQQHWRRHLPRNSAFTVPRWKCDIQTYNPHYLLYDMGMGQYLLIPYFSGMNIHLPAILGFTRYQGFDPSPYVWCLLFDHH